MPARYAVDTFVGRASPHLTLADTEWRAKPSTEKQRDFLARYDQALADRAVYQQWTRGRVADTLTAIKTARRLRPSPR